jgi:hypothetical protein
MVRLSTNTNNHYYVTTHPARLAAPVPRFIEPVRLMVVLSNPLCARTSGRARKCPEPPDAFDVSTCVCEFRALVCFGTTRKVGGETSFTKITPDETAFKLAFRHSPATRFGSGAHQPQTSGQHGRQTRISRDHGLRRPIALSRWGWDRRTFGLVPSNLEPCCRSVSCRQRSNSPGGIDCRVRPPRPFLYENQSESLDRLTAGAGAASADRRCADLI